MATSQTFRKSCYGYGCPGSAIESNAKKWIWPVYRLRRCLFTTRTEDTLFSYEHAGASGCCYRRPIAFPDKLDFGLRVGNLGNSGVRYEIGTFLQGEPDFCAHGYFVHVFVERATNRSTPVHAPTRAALTKIPLAKLNSPRGRGVSGKSGKLHT